MGAVKADRPTKAQLDDIPGLDLTKAKVLGRGLKKDRRMSLRALRVATGKSQTDVATAAGMDQSEVSRLESRDDVKLSTLRRYVRALGGDVAIVVELESGHRVRVEI